MITFTYEIDLVYWSLIVGSFVYATLDFFILHEHLSMTHGCQLYPKSMWHLHITYRSMSYFHCNLIILTIIVFLCPIFFNNFVNINFFSIHHFTRACSHDWSSMWAFVPTCPIPVPISIHVPTFAPVLLMYKQIL